MYLSKTGRHWGQGDVIRAYYASRTGEDQPLVAYQMNWKGENFYTGNRMPAFKSTGAPFTTWMPSSASAAPRSSTSSSSTRAWGASRARRRRGMASHHHARRQSPVHADARGALRLARPAHVDRATWNGAKLCATGMSSITLMFTCAGCDAAQTMAPATSSADSGCMPA